MKKMEAILALAALLALVGCGPMGNSGPPPKVDLSKITVKTIDGKTIHLADWKGDVIVIDFWGTWCGPCRRELPELGELEKEYRDKGVKFLGVAVQSGADGVRKFAKEKGVEFPMTLSTPELEETFGGISGVPTTFVFDKDGNIVKRFVGIQPKETFSKLFDQLLKP